MTGQTVILPDATAVAQEAAARFIHSAHEAVASRGRFSVALSGGSTPGVLYRLLAEEPARAQVPWPQVHLFWSDERCVPPDHPESNFRLANETLIARVPIPPDNVHRVPGEMTPKEAAQSYSSALQDFFCGPLARLDLVLLGLGHDGHTASLFPDSPALRERERLVAVAEAQVHGQPAQRVTLTLKAINTARQVLFLVTGADKAEIVHAVLDGPGVRFPAQRIRPGAGELTWLIDSEAAGQLKSRR